jgi:hypothetical protein
MPRLYFETCWSTRGLLNALLHMREGGSEYGSNTDSLLGVADRVQEASERPLPRTPPEQYWISLLGVGKPKQHQKATSRRGPEERGGHTAQRRGKLQNKLKTSVLRRKCGTDNIAVA